MGLKHIMICEPLELEYVAAGLDGHDVRILDLLLERDFAGVVRRFRPHIIGSSCYITGVNEVHKLFRHAKAIDPQVLTVVGGVQASRVPESFIDPCTDVIVRGDGTTVMREIVEAVAQHTPLQDIPGLCLPLPDGTLVDTGERVYMPAADTLPLPRRDLVAHLRHRYYYLMHRPVATIKTAWGCWYHCNFCYTWQITDGHAYARSPESIADELATIEAEDVYIVDDIFLIKPSRLARLAQLLRQRGIRKKYLVYARADFIAEHEDIIAEWAELGLTAVFIGLEAVTDPELTSMHKESSVDANRAAIDVLRRHRIDTYGSLIPDPQYTKDDFERLWRFISDMGLYYVNISPLTPMPGTDIWPEWASSVTVPPSAHGLWDLSHVVLPTRLPLKTYYRELLWLYVRTALDPRRARQHAQRTLPSIFSRNYVRLIWGALQIGRQFLRAHRHHTPAQLAKAQDRGPLPPASITSGGSHGYRHHTPRPEPTTVL